jgi:replicative DNA helicase
VVIFLFREEYYLSTKEPDINDDAAAYAKWQEKLARVNGKAEVIVEKHRHGPTGAITMGFEKQFTRYYNLANEALLPERTR